MVISVMIGMVIVMAVVVFVVVVLVTVLVVLFFILGGYVLVVLVFWWFSVLPFFFLVGSFPFVCSFCYWCYPFGLNCDSRYLFSCLHFEIISNLWFSNVFRCVWVIIDIFACRQSRYLLDMFL